MVRTRTCLEYMAPKGTSDPRYRINIEIGMRAMIQEDGKSDLIPCYVKDIITHDPMNEAGIKVICEDGKVGRIKHIGTETSCMIPMELISNLERKLRYLIAQELSKNDPVWWENKIPPVIKEKVALEKQKGRTYKKNLQIPNYDFIEEVYFSDLYTILSAKKNWKNNFEKIFHDRDALKVKLSELALLRNLPAHSKDLTAHLERKIQVYYDDIILYIENHVRKSING